VIWLFAALLCFGAAMAMLVIAVLLWIALLTGDEP